MEHWPSASRVWSLSPWTTREVPQSGGSPTVGLTFLESAPLPSCPSPSGHCPQAVRKPGRVARPSPSLWRRVGSTEWGGIELNEAEGNGRGWGRRKPPASPSGEASLRPGTGRCRHETNQAPGMDAYIWARGQLEQPSGGMPQRGPTLGMGQR